MKTLFPLWSPLLCFLLLAPLLAPPLDAAADSETDELIAEFRRFYRGRASVDEKVEAIYVLAKTDSPEAVEALVECFDDKDFTVRQTAIDVLGGYRNEACALWLIENIVANRRESNTYKKMVAVEALAGMGHLAAVEPITQLLTDRDDDLRRACARALGELRATDAVPALSRLLEDPDDTVRIAALDALGAIGAPSANPAVLAQLDSDRWQVRAAAALALSRLRQKESIQPLIDRLRQEEGRLRDDVAAALLSLTTFDLGYDADKWQKQWDYVKDRFEVPSEAEVRKAREAYEKAQLRYAPGKDDFAGIPTTSKRIVYVIDISGSMEDPLLDRQKFVLEGRTYSSFVKMEVVRQELIRTIENLDDTVFFNIVAFATEVDRWKDRGLVQANILNRKAAVRYVEKLQPIGGASQNLKLKAGLSRAAGAEMGKTNTYAALMEALDAKAAQAGYDTDLGSPVDTIFFLSDGDPTAGEITEVDRILAEVKRANALRKIRINTINIGRNTRGKELMKALAQQSGGVFIDLGE